MFYHKQTNMQDFRTPIEYERLQTLPDNYTCGVAENERRSMCGDGWTVDIIAPFFEALKD